MLWQSRFFDRALRTVKEYHEKVNYIHRNPVTVGLVSRPEDWRWSSVRDFTGGINGSVAISNVLTVDRVLLPVEERTRI